MTQLALLLVLVGGFCGLLGLAGWVAEIIGDALTVEFRDEQERLQ